MSFDFDAAVVAPFRMRPGLRRLAPGARQLSLAGRGSRHLLEKLAVLGRHHPRALQQATGFDARPALDALMRQAQAEHGSAFGWDGHRASARELGWSVAAGQVAECESPASPPLPEVGDCLRRLPQPWRLAGLLSLAFAEDFAIIDGRSACIPWLAVTLPSHWAPEDKVGRHFAQVHAPVADNRQLLAAGAALARLVSGPQRWERFVWSITPHARLNAHPALPVQAWRQGDAEAVADQACWRTERQSFIPVADAQQAVFAITVDSQPLREAIRGGAEAARLHDALASMSDAVLRYRGLDPVRQPLLQWLAGRAAA